MILPREDAEMIPYERQQKILRLIEGRELVRLEELEEKIPGVSSSTLRRDIKELERLGKVERLQGGAVKAASPASEMPTSMKTALHAGEKAAIAKRAALEVQDGETIYLDSGTTCTALFRELAGRDVNVVTTNTEILPLALADSGAHITLLGGSYDPSIGSLSGPLTQDNIKRHVFSRAFLGANGVDARFGITTPSLAEAAKKQLVAEHSQHVYVLADSSKFHQVAAIQTLALADVTVISDRSDEDLEGLASILYGQS